MSNLIPLLSRTSLFRGLEPEVIEAIASEGHERSYRRGQTIFFEGEPSDAFYVIAEGTVKVFVLSEAGEQMVFATLRSPESLGDVALFDGGPRSASAEALETTRLAVFPLSTVATLVRDDARVARALLGAAGVLLRRLSTQTADFVFLDLEGRVAKALVISAGRRSPEGDHALHLDLRLTQSELGAMVGGSRQSVNQSLHALAHRGFISIDGRKVVVRDLEALRRRAGLDVSDI
jgi:CRP/FNR family transcriptional regulator, cyclic AMP receptor protein